VSALAPSTIRIKKKRKLFAMNSARNAPSSSHPVWIPTLRELFRGRRLRSKIKNEGSGLLQKAGLEHERAAVNAALDVLWIINQVDLLDQGSALEVA
jgi:hypothetical protein